MKEKHHSKKPFDYVIREPEDHDAQKKSDEKPSEVRRMWDLSCAEYYYLSFDSVGELACRQNYNIFLENW